MGGGLLQLIAVGQLDEYLSIKPELSYYQYVYKRHTNFALESRSISFSKNPVLSPVSSSSTYECVITRDGDLLSNLYFCFTLPDIYSSSKYKFRWIKNVGSSFIKKASLYIDGMMIDQTTGEWMNVWNELSTNAADNKFDSMIGNVPEMHDPKASFTRVSIKNNKFIYFYYPESSPDKPSIESRRIVVPLRFWFTKSSALSLPLMRLQYHVVTVKIEVESAELLYQVYSDDLGMYISPRYYNELYNDNITIETFLKNNIQISIDPYIEAEYVFLDEEERNTMFVKSKLTYLAQQLTMSSWQNVNTNQNLNVLVNNPTKELIWTVKRNDVWKFNEYFNYSADVPESKNGILDRAIIRFNNNNRIEEKNAEYFNLIQPYQYHSKIPKQGIYCYSFDLFPEKEMLSGYYNAALVTTNLYLELKQQYNNDYINGLLRKLGKPPYDVSYNINVYAINYNIFEIVGAQAGMKFTVST